MRDDLAYEELLDVLEKRLQIVRRYSGSYHLEKITSALFTGVKDQKLNVYFKPKCTGAGNATTSLWECLDADWHSHERSHYMLVGEGGSGKTIAMQSTSQLALEQSVPAIYVPLHDLDDKGDSKYKPIESYIRRSVLHDDPSLWDILHKLCIKGNMQERPCMLLFLDGWNEIKDWKVGNDWFSDILTEEMKNYWMSFAGVQVILAGRERADNEISWNIPISYMEIQSLDRKQITNYLNNYRIGVPEYQDLIWHTLKNPLMLTLYVNAQGQKDQFKSITGIHFISGRRHSSQAAVIWNFLQCQIGKSVKQNPGHLWNYFIAINYAAAWIGWNMEQEQKYKISEEEIKKLLWLAGKNYQRWWKKSDFLHNIEAKKKESDSWWDSGEIKRILCEETFLLHNTVPNEDVNAGSPRQLEFIHQKFRDCFAAMFMRGQLAPYGNESYPEACSSWRDKAASTEVLDLLHTFFSLSQIDNLWREQRDKEAKNNSFVMYHLLELYRRQGKSLDQLDFSWQDLRYISLQNRGLNASGMNFRGAKISRRTVLPQGHASTISCVAWLPVPNRKYCNSFFSSGIDLRQWDIHTGELLEQWSDHTSGITCICTSMDGYWFATTSHDRKLLIYNIKAPKEPVAYNAYEELIYAAFHPSGKYIAVGGTRGVVYICSTCGKKIADIEVPNDCSDRMASVGKLVFDTEGNFLAVLDQKNTLFIWKIMESEADFRFILLYSKHMEEESGEILDIRFDTKGTCLSGVTMKGNILCIDISSKKKTEHLLSKNCIWKSASFSHDGSRLAAFDGKELGLWLVSEKRKYQSFVVDETRENGSVMMLAFSTDGTRILCILGDGTLRIWNAEIPMGEEFSLRQYIYDIGPADSVMLKIIPLTDKTVLCSFGNGFLLWLDIEEKRCFRQEKINDGPVFDMAFSADKKIFAAIKGEHTICFWKMDNILEDFSEFAMVTADGTISDITFSPDGSYVFCASENHMIYGWTVPDFSLCTEIDCKDARIVSLAFLSDNILAGGADNGEIFLWKIPEGKEIKKYSGVHNDTVSRICVADNGHRMVSASHDGKILKWDFKNHKISTITNDGSLWKCAAISANIDYVLGGKIDPFNKMHSVRSTNVHFWHLTDEENVKSPIETRCSIILDVCFLASGTDFAFTNDERISIININHLDQIDNIGIIPNISFVDADFRSAEFEDDELMELVRMSGAIVV